MSIIVTFYSYKGGVGRSMALANVAFELARQGKKILMVDWDLEAPGLEKYFSNFSMDTTGAGLLPLLLDAEQGITKNYKDYLWYIHTNPSSPSSSISFLHSGREKDPNNYSKKLENFDWEDFFQKNGAGAFFEKLRLEWLNDFDIVLIDSRTGLSDSSGICTILLPDVVVPLFTANHQSLYGVRDIMRYAKIARQKLEVDRMALTILPVPTRFGSRVEFKESQEWLDRFADTLKEFFADWLPVWIEPKHVLEQVKIPQVDYFSFGEKLAVAEHGTSDPESMGFIYAKIASLLSSNFEDLVSFVGKEYYNSKKDAYENSKKQKSKAIQSHEYDVYISHPHTSLTNLWISEFGSVFTEYLTEELGYAPKIFVDVQEISVGVNWSEKVMHSLQSSKVLLVLLSPDYLSNKNNLFELQTFAEKEKVTNEKLIFTVSLKHIDNSALPASLHGKAFADFSEFNVEELRKSTKLKVRFALEVEKLAKLITASIKGNANKLFTPDNKNPDDYLDEIKVLAKEYEELRKIMPSGENRTRLMEYVTTKMKTESPKIIPYLAGLTKSNSPGERLAAIATLQKEPDLKYLDWLADRVGDTEAPFIGYAASVGLYISAKTFCKSHKDEIAKAIDKAIDKIEVSKYRDPSQISVLNTAKTELGFIKVDQ